MSITNLNVVREGNITHAEAVSDLVGSVIFHWYIDGSPAASTRVGEWSTYLPDDEYVRIEVLDTIDPNFDTVANAPLGFPARRTLFWTRSADADVAMYRIEQQQDGGAWSSIGQVVQADWSFTFLSPILLDGSDYAWRVIPIDAAGNDGTALTLATTRVVRIPDPLNFTATFDVGTTKVTFAQVA